MWNVSNPFMSPGMGGPNMMVAPNYNMPNYNMPTFNSMPNYNMSNYNMPTFNSMPNFNSTNNYLGYSNYNMPTFNSMPTFNNYLNYSNNYNMSNYNTTNIYNNYFGNSTPQFPMFQGQMFGNPMSQFSMFQGQMFGNPMPQFPMPQFPMPQFPMPQYSIMDSLNSMINQVFMSSLYDNIFADYDWNSAFDNMFSPPPIDQTIIDIIAKGWGDPHFVVTNSKGEQLTTDHKGIDDNTYNILDARGDDGLLIDAKYVHWSDEAPQVMGTMRVMAGNDELIFDRDGTATLNGQALEKGKSYTAADGTKIKYLEDGNMEIVSKENDATINLINQGGSYLDIEVEGGSKLGNGNKELGGVLGTLLNNRDNLDTLGKSRVTDVNGDGISDDLNGDNFIDDKEFAKLGYNFDVTNTRAIA